MAVEAAKELLKTLNKNMSVPKSNNIEKNLKIKNQKKTMPPTKKLQKQIETKLEKLSKLLGKINEAQVIDSNDPQTWDSDALYDLVENLKEALQLLEDEERGSLILGKGLCTLVDEYNEKESEDF